MNDNDIGLIIDLIDGTLGASEADAALARIEADPELSSAYAEQLSIRASLEAAPKVAMTVEEKAAINTALVEQLRLDDAVAVVPIAKRRAPWWAPVVGITAAAAAVTAIFIVPGMSGSDDAASDTTIVASAAERAPSEQDAGTDAGAAAEEDGSQEFSDVSEALEAPAAPLTVVDLEGADLVDVLDATAGESSPDAVEDRLNTLGYTGVTAVDPDVLARCISDISSQLPPNTADVVLFGVDSSGATPIAHIGLVFDGEDGIEAAMSIDLGSCAIVEPGN